MKTISILLVLLVPCLCREFNFTSTIKVLSKEEIDGLTMHGSSKADTIWAKEKIAVPVDNGSGNYGDLIYKGRQNGDVLFVRDVVLIPALDADQQDIQWYTTIRNARVITSVRVLNFGRERAYTLRIDVAGQDAQVIFRVPSYQDPRLLIEVYGY